MKNLIKKIRKAKTWRERAEIALDKWPGTPSDELFKEAQLAKDMENKYRPLTHQSLEFLGAWVATRILRREVQSLHTLADDLAELKQHEPQPDYDLITLFNMSGMFPPGWEKTWGRDSRTGKMAPGYSAVPRGRRVKIAMRDLRKSLERKGVDVSDGAWEKHRKKLQRYAKEFKIQLDDTPSSRP
ncbi:MAG TPA: hypothetical protein VN784_08170 [Candidatus Limnocylindrales bacterium]|nr:hypothetical protein [Candidatus Limnocylindrales bacterium]